MIQERTKHLRRQQHNETDLMFCATFLVAALRAAPFPLPTVPVGGEPLVCTGLNDDERAVGDAADVCRGETRGKAGACATGATFGTRWGESTLRAMAGEEAARDAGTREERSLTFVSWPLAVRGVLVSFSSEKFNSLLNHGCASSSSEFGRLEGSSWRQTDMKFLQSWLKFMGISGGLLVLAMWNMAAMRSLNWLQGGRPHRSS